MNPERRQADHRRYCIDDGCDRCRDNTNVKENDSWNQIHRGRDDLHHVEDRSKDPSDPSKLKVELLDPQAEMLYWLVPILERQGGGVPGDAKKKDYLDFMSIHAGHEFDWSKLR